MDIEEYAVRLATHFYAVKTLEKINKTAKDSGILTEDEMTHCDFIDADCLKIAETIATQYDNIVARIPGGVEQINKNLAKMAKSSAT